MGTMRPVGDGRDPWAWRQASWPPPDYDHPLPQKLHDIGAGLLGLPSAPEQRRHHFVPRMLLRGFETSPGSRVLFHYDKREKRASQVSISSSAWDERLYGGFDEAGGHDNRVEAFLGLTEEYAAPAIELLLDARQPLTEHITVPLSLLFGLQVGRTPRALDAVGAFVERQGQAMLGAVLDDPRAFAQLIASRDGKSRTPAELEAMRAEHRAVLRDGAAMRLGNGRDAGLKALVRNYLDAGLAMAHADWWVLRADPGSFVISDCGFARLETEDRMAGGAIAFPLRHDACVLVAAPTTDTTSVRRGPCAPAFARRINLRSYGWSERFVFGHSEHAVTRVREQAKKSPRQAREPTAEDLLPSGPTR